jgi:uncharacterized membrane protein YccF (DUF307 family)
LVNSIEVPDRFRLNDAVHGENGEEMSAVEKNGGLMSQAAVLEPVPPAGGVLAGAPAGGPGLEAAVPAAGGYGNPTAVNHVATAVNNTVNVNMAMPSIQMNTMAKGHSLVTRVLWYCFVGWWLSAIFIVLGVFFTWTVVLMPLGFWFINRIPKAQTMRERTRQFTTEFKDNAIVFTEGNKDQVPWYIRAPYALTIGAVAGIAWLSVAWVFGILVVTLPLSIWMIDRAPAIMTLEKN